MLEVGRAGPESVPDVEKTKVFISYSRKDRDFVDRLIAALEAHDHISVVRDTDDILPTEEWKGRLERLIGEADTIVFCLSPDSAASDICRWEAGLAEQLNKRIAPIVLREVADEIPAALAKLNYIFFTKPEEFARSLGYLVTALDADIEWVREHTRIGELSRHWERSGKQKDQLLRGADLDAAEAWLKRHPRNAPRPPDLTNSYVLTSREEATARARRMLRSRVAVVAISFGFLAAASYALWENRLYLQLRAATLVDAWLPKVLSVDAERSLKPGHRFRECAACPEMIVLPAGEFVMGALSDGFQNRPLSGEKVASGGESPQRRVTIPKRFAVGAFEVTFDEWDACVALGGCLTRAYDPGWGRGKRPVIYVGWEDAQQYVKWLSKRTGRDYRLLTEAEWEYAARAGTITFNSWGDEIGSGLANCEKCGSPWGGKQTAPVGSFPPNAFGLHDMEGNVWELVEDVWVSGYEGAPSDGSARGDDPQERRRVARGGAWDLGLLPVTRRMGFTPDSRGDSLGFRVARTLMP
jgi:formylglycine-generating enzyme required for sulfatase activity